MSEWDNFPVAKGDSWEDYPEAPQPSFADGLKGAVRKGVEFLAPNIAAQHPMGTPGDLSGTVTAGILRDVKTAPQSAAQLALGDPTQGEAQAAAGNILRVAPPLTSAGAASRLGTGIAARPVLPRPATPEVPTPAKMLEAAQQQGYRPVEQQALATPVQDYGPTIEGLKAHANKNTANTEAIFKEIDKLAGKDNAGGLFQLRDDLHALGGKDSAAAKTILPKVEVELERLVPGSVEKLRIADQNYGAGKVGERFSDRVTRKEMQRSGELGNRLRDAAKEEVTQASSKYLKPPDEAALMSLNQGTRGQNLLELSGRHLNSVPAHVGIGIATGGFGNVPFWAASRAMRGLYNRSVARQADVTSQAIAQRSPLYIQRMADHAATVAAYQRQMAAQAEMHAAQQGLLGRAAVPSLLGAQQQSLLPAQQ